MSKEQFQTKLHRARPAGPEQSIGTGHVRRLRPQAEKRASIARRIGILVGAAGSSERVGDIRVVENVEELGSELRSQTFPKPPILA